MPPIRNPIATQAAQSRKQIRDRIGCSLSETRRAIGTAAATPLDIDAADCETGPDGAGVVIEIGDSGSGMPPEIRERAFEPFFTPKPAGQGTGLGLAQVAGFVKDAEGFCGLDSKPGEGTIVRLFLPAACDTGAGRADRGEGT